MIGMEDVQKLFSRLIVPASRLTNDEIREIMDNAKEIKYLLAWLSGYFPDMFEIEIRYRQKKTELSKLSANELSAKRIEVLKRKRYYESVVCKDNLSDESFMLPPRDNDLSIIDEIIFERKQTIEVESSE